MTFLMVCECCGSEDVIAEVTAVRWNVKTQQWYVSGDLCDKGHYCGNCDDQCRIVAQPIEE